MLAPARPPQPGRPWDGKLTVPSTIDRRISGVVVTARRQLKMQLQKDIAEEARALLKVKVKVMEKDVEDRGRGPAPALLVRHMEKAAATLPRNRFGVRDLALMTLHFAIAGREHELAHLRVRDITEDPEGRGLIVDVPVSKVAPRKVEVPFGSRAHLCPVRAWRRWKDELGQDADPDSYAFRAVHNRWKTVLDSGLDPESVGDVLTRIGARAQLDIRPTGHSPAADWSPSPPAPATPTPWPRSRADGPRAPRSCAATARKTTASRRTPCTACCRSRRSCPPWGPPGPLQAAKQYTRCDVRHGSLRKSKKAFPA
ncbi:hypothetical protein GCM10011578_088510 [Streptomyces fuscichromogenes]|uniref:Integrase n=1 Tax=Streptomyces fuscichromogenes TaxID=1324013 RepID=A0A917XN18_9ACTN|nr:hypothetical protein GCM10011578_088510 [Streptomyces fuscichromogenes]